MSFVVRTTKVLILGKSEDYTESLELTPTKDQEECGGFNRLFNHCSISSTFTGKRKTHQDTVIYNTGSALKTNRKRKKEP